MQRLKLRTPRTQRLRFLAGQSARVTLPGGAEASFSIASCPCDDMNIEFHIAANTDDSFNQQLQHIKASDKVEINGPDGSFVLDYHDTRPLVMIAMDDQFAAIKSLIEHAVTLDLAEFIQLYWITASPSDHYLDNVCRSWADAFEQFHYHVMHYEPQNPVSLPAAINDILQQHPVNEDAVYYIDAGPASRHSIMTTLKTAGVESERLHFNQT